MTASPVIAVAPPTADEVRALVVEALTSPSSAVDANIMEAIAQVIDDAAAILRAPAWDIIESTDPRVPENMAPGLWADLRSTEASRLMELVTAASVQASKRCEAIILDELTAAGVQFAREFPEAPRPA